MRRPNGLLIAAIIFVLSAATPGCLRKPADVPDAPVAPPSRPVTPPTAPIVSADQPAEVAALLKQFSLAVATGDVYRFDVTVPSSWEAKLGEYPVGLYWAMANVVSKDAGYDLSTLKGKTVSVWKARLLAGLRPRDPSVDYQYPTDVIVLLDGKQVVGGWLSWNTSIIGPSLNKRWFEDITDLSFEQWVLREGYFQDAGDNTDLGRMKPEEVLAAFFKAINEGDKTRAYSCLTPWSAFEMLVVNKPFDCLYNESPHEDNSMVDNIVSGKLLSWRYYDPDLPAKDLAELGDRTGVGLAARVDMKWRAAWVDSGEQMRFALMRNDGLGWKLDGLGTGP